MTNLIDQRFAKLKEAGETALIPFLTVGDPDLETSIAIMKELERAGADMIELGVPYSDPLADGPVIQRASLRALKNGITVLDCIGAAKSARKAGVTIPFILFTYYNPVLQLGLERTFDLLRDNDISGLIIPDLPMEEDAPVKELADKQGIHLIPLVAPTSNTRVSRIAAKATGFVYCVSSLGVTGERTQFYEGIDTFLGTVREASDIPIGVGFGISNREQALYFAERADAIIVGSAIVRTIEEALPLLASPATRENGLLQIYHFVRELKP